MGEKKGGMTMIIVKNYVDICYHQWPVIVTDIKVPHCTTYSSSANAIPAGLGIIMI